MSVISACRKNVDMDVKKYLLLTSIDAEAGSAPILKKK
jgi:hypothetical protein